jgi:hypothetical protein
MIDPITAFATAQAAIKGVKAAIALGKDIQAVSGDLMKFFEAKDVVQKEASKPKSSFAKSDTAQAFEFQLTPIEPETDLKWSSIASRAQTLAHSFSARAPPAFL